MLVALIVTFPWIFLVTICTRTSICVHDHCNDVMFVKIIEINIYVAGHLLFLLNVLKVTYWFAHSNNNTVWKW